MERLSTTGYKSPFHSLVTAKKTQLIASCLLILSTYQATAANLLIDDFGVNQAELRTGQLALLDTVYDDSILGGHRVLHAGGASVEGNCDTTTMAVEVSNGVMTIHSGQDCYGSGAAIWGGDGIGLNLDASKYIGLRLHIAELVGTAESRFSVYSEGTDTQRLNALIKKSGRHDVFFSEFPDAINLENIYTIVISTGVGLDEFVAIDSVSFLIPEPSAFIIASAILASLITLRNTRSR